MRKNIFLLAAALLSSSLASAAEKKDSLTFTIVKENPITSIKNQAKSGTCWCFSGLAFLESELLRKGKGTYDLAESFVVRKTYIDRAVASVRMHGDISFAQGGSFYDVIYCLKNYGMLPQEAMAEPGSLYGDTLYNHNELSAVSSAYVKALTDPENKLKSLSPQWTKPLEAIYDNYIGAAPEQFSYKGKTYTAKSFAQSLGLNPDDYVSLTSYTHHPFYEKFILEIPDNWRWDAMYNVPLDELMETIDYAIDNGYTIGWASDVSEEGFKRTGVATMPDKAKKQDTAGSDAARWTGEDKSTEAKTPATDNHRELVATQAMRQKAFDNWDTTDDHGMQIFGKAKDQYGRDFYVVKNSWGKTGDYKGLFYASKAFAAYKTMSILINREAIPKGIARKLGLK